MGFLGSLFGGGDDGGGAPYKASYDQDYQDLVKNALFQRLGATKNNPSSASSSNSASSSSPAASSPASNQGNTYDQYMAMAYPKTHVYLPGVSKDPSPSSPAKPEWDTSNVGVNPTVASATSPYASNYANIDSALNSYKTNNYNPTAYTKTNYSQTYDPYHFDYATPEASNLQYNQGASQINRSGADNLQQIQSAVGTRRPGLLLRAAQGNARQTQGQLGNLSTSLAIQRLQDRANQEQNQAGENFKGYSSRAANEAANAGENQFAANFGEGQAKTIADNAFRNAQAGQQGNLAEITSKQGVTQQAQDNLDKALNYLMQVMFHTSNLNAGQQSQANAQQAQTGGNVLGSIASAASSIIPFL